MSAEPRPSSLANGATESEWVNVSLRMSKVAARRGGQIAVAAPVGRAWSGETRFREISFAELDGLSSKLAAGMQERGFRPGMRIVLMVRPGIEFFVCVFAMLKAGLVMVLVDPGLGRRHLVECLTEVEPEGFVAVPLAHAARIWYGRRFPRAVHHVTVGRRWFWGGPTYAELIASGAGGMSKGNGLARTRAGDPAAIIFTSGSTGAPKGVLYTHENFDRQVVEIQKAYGIAEGEIDLPAFPLFGLFNAAMGVTSVVPRMDFTRPAQADPKEILTTANTWRVTQSFGSPALWNTVGRYCERHSVRFETLRRVLAAGAPAAVHILARLKKALPEGGEIHTPYGATESLPVATISASEVLDETAAVSARGGGTCVGGRLPFMDWRVIRISDGPIERIEEAEEISQGEIGELMVRGPVVTREYVTRKEANSLHKVKDGESIWHRMGDVGYLDDRGRFWFCGRKSQRVETAEGVMFTIPSEAIFNQHARIYRTALVGVGERPAQIPAIVAETWPEHRPTSTDDERRLLDELRKLALDHPHTRTIQHFFLHPSLPVDIRHNAKIFREKLAEWAAERMRNEGQLGQKRG